MWRLVILGVIAAYTVVIALAAEPAKPKPVASAAPSAWSKAAATIDAVYSADVDDETTEEIVAAFVSNAGKQGDKTAPLTGTREQKAAYYLAAYAKLVRSIHDEIYLRAEAQQAADARVAELKARLPK